MSNIGSSFVPVSLATIDALSPLHSGLILLRSEDRYEDHYLPQPSSEVPEEARRGRT
jgi:hypothetical protein